MFWLPEKKKGGNRCNLEVGQTHKVQFNMVYFVIALLPSQKYLGIIPANPNTNLVDCCLSAHSRAARKPTSPHHSLCFHLSITHRVNVPSTVLAWQLDPQTKAHHVTIAWQHAIFYEHTNPHRKKWTDSHTCTHKHNPPTYITHICIAACKAWKHKHVILSTWTNQWCFSGQEISTPVFYQITLILHFYSCWLYSNLTKKKTLAALAPTRLCQNPVLLA